MGDTSNNEKPTLVIGDVHGHADRLCALLQQEGVLDDDGKRIDYGVRVVQVGDLGHFGAGGDSHGDHSCYVNAHEWLDTVLWGNHDRPVVESALSFGGYENPKIYYPELYRAVLSLWNSGKMALATHAHGHLITHAGLHPHFERYIPDDQSLEDFVDEVNIHFQDEMVLAVSFARGGTLPYGGILWRDDNREKLSRRWPQVYGHTAQFGGQVVERDGSWNVDVGGKVERSLAGVWLPEGRVARIDL